MLIILLLDCSVLGSIYWCPTVKDEDLSLFLSSINNIACSIIFLSIEFQVEISTVFWFPMLLLRNLRLSVILYMQSFFFFSMETKFRNFTVKCLRLFSTICQVAGGPFQSGESLDPETFSSIIFLRLLNIFFSVLFPFNSSYSDVYPPWTVKPLFPFLHVLLLLFVLFLEKFLNFIF